MDIKAKDTAVPAGLNWRNKTRRRYTPQQRLSMVQECAEPGVSISEVAQRNRVNTNLLFKWCRLHKGRKRLAKARGLWRQSVLNGYDVLEGLPRWCDESGVFHFHANERNHYQLILRVEGQHLAATV